MDMRMKKDNRGTALFVAIVVCAIVCVFSLALLSLSYSVFVGEAEKKTSLAGREMTKMASRLIEKELSAEPDNNTLSDYVKQGILTGTWESGEHIAFLLDAGSSEETLNQLASSIKVYFTWEETGESLASDPQDDETEEENQEKNLDETVEKIFEEADVNIVDAVETIEESQTETTEETEPTGKRLSVYILYEENEQRYVWEDIYFLSIEGGKWIWYPEKRGVPANGNE